MKIGDRTAYVFIGRIAEQFQLRPVGAQDGPVCAHQVQGESAILKKVFVIFRGSLGT